MKVLQHLAEKPDRELLRDLSLHFRLPADLRAVEHSLYVSHDAHTSPDYFYVPRSPRVAHLTLPPPPSHSDPARLVVVMKAIESVAGKEPAAKHPAGGTKANGGTNAAVAVVCTSSPSHTLHTPFANSNTVLQDVRKASLICQVRDLFPDLGEGTRVAPPVAVN